MAAASTCSARRGAVRAAQTYGSGPPDPAHRYRPHPGTEPQPLGGRRRLPDRPAHRVRARRPVPAAAVCVTAAPRCVTAGPAVCHRARPERVAFSFNTIHSSGSCVIDTSTLFSAPEAALSHGAADTPPVPPDVFRAPDFSDIAFDESPDPADTVEPVAPVRQRDAARRDPRK